MHTEIPHDVRQVIEQRLTRVADEEGIRYLLAVESGSRAWGFPSPDSDYDVRFIYLRPRDDYLALSAVRDVVERPIVDEIDLNGWDIRKALGLMLKNNAVMSEWIESPIRYCEDDPIVAGLADLGDRHFDPRGYARHYSSLGKSNFDRWIAGDGPIPVKKYFYSLRPALAIRALRLDPSRRPPMQLQALIDYCDLKPPLTRLIERLVALKAETKEAESTERIPDIVQLISSELARADEVTEKRQTEAFGREAEALFRDLVNAD